MIFGSRIYAAGISEGNARGWVFVWKINISNIVKFWVQSLSRPHYHRIYQQERKGFVIDFIILWLIFYISNMLEEKEKQKQ